MPKRNESPCCQSSLLGNEDAPVLVGGLISFMGLLWGFSPSPTSITLAWVRANNAPEVCHHEVFGEFLDQQRVTFPKGKFTHSQCLWSECPLERDPSTLGLLTAYQRQQKRWWHPDPTYFILISEQLLKTTAFFFFLVFVISRWIKTT